MTTPIRILPVVERWDCHGCAHCCRGTTIPLSASDLQTLEGQRWQDHPDLRNVRTVVRARLLGARHVLAKRPDGSCVFLTDAGRCRIHELHGADAKPAVCRIFPLQVVPMGTFAWITLRRSCPSAAAERGRPVAEHLAALHKSGLVDRLAPPLPQGKQTPPRVVRGVQRSWPEFLATANALARLMTDQHMPLVRRLVHGLQFCALLDRCKLKRVRPESWPELMQLLESSATEDAGTFFRDRQPPSRGSEMLLRQIGTHYVRSFPGCPATTGWRQQWRLLRATARFRAEKVPFRRCTPRFPPPLLTNSNAPSDRSPRR